MRLIIPVAALVWFAVAAPSEAAAFTVAAHHATPSLRFEANGGAARFDRFGGRGLTFGHPAYDRRHKHRADGFRRYGSDPFLPGRAIARSPGARRFCRNFRSRLGRGLYYTRARDAYGRLVHLVIDRRGGKIIRLRYR